MGFEWGLRAWCGVVARVRRVAKVEARYRVVSCLLDLVHYARLHCAELRLEGLQHLASLHLSHGVNIELVGCQSSATASWC